MAATASRGFTSVVTGRGLEITIPTPYVVQGCLAPLLVLAVAVAFVLFMAGQNAGEAAHGWLGAADRMFGLWWLAAGAGAAVLTLAFSRYSNTHYIFGTRTLRDQGRVGRVVISDDDLPLSRIGAVEVVPDPVNGSRWCVRCASKRIAKWPAVIISPLGHDEAVELAEQIRDWLDDPQQARPHRLKRTSTPVLVAEAVLGIVSTRITLVVPLLLGGGALLALALGWQLQAARHGRAQPLPRLDRVADGELQSFRWILHPPRSHSDASWPGMWLIGVQLAVDYTADDGQRRTLWLTTRPLSREAIGNLGPGQLRRVAALFGPPPREFVVPAWAREAIHNGDSWPQWSETVAGEYSFDAQYRAAELLSLLDEPFYYLTSEWTAPAPDWRIAYSSLDPERAMPARWADAERLALAEVSLHKLLPAGVVALLLVFWMLPRLFAPSRSRRWVGRLVVLALVLTVPVWAEHAERSAMRLGISSRANDAAADVLRLAAPAPLAAHAFLGRSQPPLGQQGLTLHWTPDRSASAALLRALSLDVPPPQLPLPDAAAATALMISRAAVALAALDDDALVAFADAYDEARWAVRAATLHEQVVGPALCAVTADPARARVRLRVSGFLECAT